MVALIDGLAVYTNGCDLFYQGIMGAENAMNVNIVLAR
jgi:hypothetical protein